MAKKGAECAFPYINILDESAFAQVRDGVYTVLQNTGVTVQSRKMRKILKDYGCRVDEERERVYFDRDVILRALEASPKGFEIKARDEKNHVLLQPGKNHSVYQRLRHRHLSQSYQGIESADEERILRIYKTFGCSAESGFSELFSVFWI